MIQVKVRLVRTIKNTAAIWFGSWVPGILDAVITMARLALKNSLNARALSKSKWLKSSCRKGQNLVKAGYYPKKKSPPKLPKPVMCRWMQTAFPQPATQPLLPPVRWCSFGNSCVNCQGASRLVLSCVSDSLGSLWRLSKLWLKQIITLILSSLMAQKAARGLRLLSLWIMLVCRYSMAFYLYTTRWWVRGCVKKSKSVSVVKSSLPLISLAC